MSCVWVYERLQSSIAVRHFSKKTFHAYRSWIRKLQNFTQSKDPALLEMEDVKAFLTALAVEHKVAASSPALTHDLARDVRQRRGTTLGDAVARRKDPYAGMAA
jgi:site-specific recombinase XerD